MDKVVSKLDFTKFLGATSTDTNMSNHASFGSIPVQAGDAGESTVFLCKRSKPLSMTSRNPWPPDRERHGWHGRGFMRAFLSSKHAAASFENDSVLAGQQPKREVRLHGFVLFCARPQLGPRSPNLGLGLAVNRVEGFESMCRRFSTSWRQGSTSLGVLAGKTVGLVQSLRKNVFSTLWRNRD